MRPEFIRVLPDEVAQCGAAGAVLLAHIRFRCQAPGPGRHQDKEGQWWWRVSLAQLAHQTGLSVQVVRTALKALTLTETLVVEHFKPLSNQTLSYRVDLPVVESNTVADLPVVAANTAHVGSNRDPCYRQHATVLAATSVLPIENLETGGERARDSEQTADPASFSAWETPPAKSPTEEQQHAPPGGGSGLKRGVWPDWEPWPYWFPKPPQRCPHGGSCTGPCHHCGAQRKWDTAEAKERRQDLNYSHAWKRYKELLREAGQAGTLDYWRPERPPTNSKSFDPDRPWYVAGPPAEEAVVA